MKMKLVLFAFCAILLAYGPPALAEEPGQWQVFVRYRHTYPFCAGFCPSFEMQVGSDGEITTHDLLTSNIFHGHAKPENLRQFRAVLDDLRPTADRRADEDCVPAKRQDGSPDSLDNPKPDDIELRWLENGKSVSLTACWSNQPINMAIIKAWYALIGQSVQFAPTEDSA